MAPAGYGARNRAAEQTRLGMISSSARVGNVAPTVWPTADCGKGPRKMRPAAAPITSTPGQPGQKRDNGRGRVTGAPFPAVVYKGAGEGGL